MCVCVFVCVFVCVSLCVCFSVYICVCVCCLCGYVHVDSGSREVRRGIPSPSTGVTGTFDLSDMDVKKHIYILCQEQCVHLSDEPYI